MTRFSSVRFRIKINIDCKWGYATATQQVESFLNVLRHIFPVSFSLCVKFIMPKADHYRVAKLYMRART